LQPFEYLLLFVVIILGLAIGDLATSTQRLLTAGKLVKWDWLAPLAGLVAFLLTVSQWWDWFGDERIARNITFPMFLAFLTAAVLLFLVCATALPDDFGEEAIDLRVFYASNARRFWLLFLAHWASTAGALVWAWISVAHGQLNQAHWAWLTLPIAAPLVFVKNRWWHGVSLVALAIFYVAPHLGQTLSH